MDLYYYKIIKIKIKLKYSKKHSIKNKKVINN